MDWFDALRERKSEKKIYGRCQGKTTTFVYHMFRELIKDQSTDIIAVSLYKESSCHAYKLFEELIKKTSFKTTNFQGTIDVWSNGNIVCCVKFMPLQRFSSLRGINSDVRVFLDPDLLETKYGNWAGIR